jgi:hypothetical protein
MGDATEAMEGKLTNAHATCPSNQPLTDHSLARLRCWNGQTLELVVQKRWKQPSERTQSVAQVCKLERNHSAGSHAVQAEFSATFLAFGLPSLYGTLLDRISLSQ